jgi:hypothetical protein
LVQLPKMARSDAYDSDEDADLRRAIALSLEGTAQAGREDTVEISSDDDDDHDLEIPYRRKPQTAPTTVSGDGKEKHAEPPASQPQAQPATTGIAGLAGLDRKKMEEERLARLAKRKAPDSEQEPQGRESRARTGPTPNLVAAVGSKNAASPAGSLAKSTTKATSSTSSQVGLRFAKGTVKKTWASGFPKTEDDITIEEILQKNELELAVISSFQWDEEWMLSKINISKTKLICVAFASSKEQVGTASPSVTIVD